MYCVSTGDSTPDLQAGGSGRGSIPEPVPMEIFSVLQPRVWWWFGTHLKLYRSLHKKVMTSREEAHGANYLGFLGDFERFICTDSRKILKTFKKEGV